MPERAFTLNCEDYSYLEVKEFLDSISGTVKEVAIRLMDGMSKKEIAKALEITPATISYHVGRLQIAYTNFFGVEV
jgi:FixJ family two-component response regulator